MQNGRNPRPFSFVSRHDWFIEANFLYLFAKPLEMSRKVLVFLFLINLPFYLAAQESRTQQEIFNEAEYFFMAGDYADALSYYLQLYRDLPENAFLAYRAGVCCLNIEGKKNLSMGYLETATRNMSSRQKEGSVAQVAAPYDALYELGEALLINYQFSKAKDAFQKYGATLMPDDHENIDFINQQIRSCEIAQTLISNPVRFTEENLGAPINDDKPNNSPVISGDGKTFAFMSAMKFYNAVLISRLVNGKWSDPVNITADLQADGEIFISCLSNDGRTLFLSINDNFNSDIFSSTYDGKKWSPAVRLNKNINTRYWESHAFVSEDGGQMVFSSDRPGGFGGLDLYISKKVKGEWGPAVKLGTEINTPFNEDRPFLIGNGKILFFSSQGHETMGGYDIFRSDLQTNGIWSKPVNTGYPINTPDDNFFFMPNDNGKSGYYPEYKEMDGSAMEDIYKITFK